MRYDLWMGERAKAETLPSGLRMLLDEKAPGKVHLRLWMPRAEKPFANYLFATREKALEFVAAKAESLEAWKKEVAARKAARAGTPELLEKVKVGDIFVSSWGYDQTNVDFYQVVERRGKMALLREVGANSSDAVSHGMADHVTAVKDWFLESKEAKWYKVQFSGSEPYFKVREFAWATPWDGKKQYRSWYA